MEYIISMAITLFFIMDPLGGIPVFLSELNVVSPQRRKRVLLRELLFALLFFLVFFFIGNYFLKVLHLSTEAIKIGGGIVLFLIALEMIFPHHRRSHDENLGVKEEPFIVPLAIPLIAGPSTLALILILKNNTTASMIENLSALIIAWFASAVILYHSTLFLKVLKKRGLIAMERLMGMILVIMSIQMLLDGIYGYFVNFHGK